MKNQNIRYFTQLERFRWFCWAFLFIIAALFLPSCVERIEDEDLYRAKRVRLKWLHQSQFAGFYVAQQKGFYKNAGIEAILNPGGIDFPAIPLVLNKSDDFGVTGADQIIKARAEGKPVIAIAVIYKRTPFCLFAWEESGIKRISDIKDKIVGVKYGGNEEFTYRAILSKALQMGELSDRDIVKEGNVLKLKNEVPVKYDLTPFLNGEVHVWPGYSINEPLLAEEKTGKKVNIISPSDYGLIIYADVLFTRDEMVKKYPEIVRNVVRATRDGWKYAINTKNFEETANYVLRYAMWSNFEHEMSMLKTSIKLVCPDAEENILIMRKEDWQNLQKIMLEYGFIDKTVEIKNVFTNEFFED